MSRNSLDTLRAKLAVFEKWPGPYLFKFIAPQATIQELEQLFEQDHYTLRTSRTGKYTSLSCQKVMASSDEVIAVYREALKIEGVIAL
jgi:hypothetical protein